MRSIAVSMMFFAPLELGHACRKVGDGLSASLVMTSTTSSAARLSEPSPDTDPPRSVTDEPWHRRAAACHASPRADTVPAPVDRSPPLPSSMPHFARSPSVKEN